MLGLYEYKYFVYLGIYSGGVQPLGRSVRDLTPV